MKKHILIFTCLFIFPAAFIAAQVAQTFDYLAVVRDSTGAALSNHVVSTRVSIIYGSIDGLIVYEETDTVTSNQLGFIELSVGSGTPVTGSFNDIQWEYSPLFLKIEMDINGGIDYADVGTSQLVSVPYALHTGGLTVSDSLGQEYTLEVDTTGDLSTLEHSSCGGLTSITDPRDGQIYEVVSIGSQCWFKRNLNLGSMINSSTDQSNNYIIEKYCYNNDTAMCSIYGGLYQWNEAMWYYDVYGSRGICPAGWHVPTDEEWDQLGAHLGTLDYYPYDLPTWWYAGGKMKETGTAHWASPNTDATNESGFTALGAGYWNETNGSFADLTVAARFFSSTRNNSTSAWLDRIIYNNGSLFSYDAPILLDANSIRCVKGEYVDPCKGVKTVTYSGTVYHTVSIGTQCWLKENLKLGVHITNNFQEPQNNGIIEKWCWNNDPYWCNTMGGLYNWNEAMKYFYTPGSQGICPSGWHVPTDEEFKILEGYADSKHIIGDPGWDNEGARGYDVGNMLRATWGFNYPGQDAFGFAVVGSGARWCNGYLLGHYQSTSLWTSSYAGQGYIWIRYFRGGTASGWNGSSYHDKREGCEGNPVRCLKD
jgi:uncharacterized protein (TIGR02145 family)